MSAHLTSWGRLSTPEHQIIPLTNLQSLPLSTKKTGLAFGNGRSYGDVCLNADQMLWPTRTLDRWIGFDTLSGLLECEAGVLLRDIQRLVIPHGWMLPVTPGTQLITIGGAIANDIHGKNHHVMGSFGDHVTHIRLLRTDGEMIECSPAQQQNWFCATVGGMGLTGVIVTASLQLRKVHGPWLLAENRSFQNTRDFFTLADKAAQDWEHTVSWIDCLHSNGRGVFMRANHVTAEPAAPTGRAISVPFTPPISLVNRLSLRPFNWAYYHLQARKHRSSVVHYEPFFHPLDNVGKWNRIYGPRGFYQYQCAVPQGVHLQAITAMMLRIAQSKSGSFLAVLKTFGSRPSLGMMSFPIHGATLALDFPNKGTQTLRLLADLDTIVGDAKGRIYAAKDACMSPNLFSAGYPRLNEFLQYRDPGISSSLSRRLLGS
jgi:FAD/FMN-containing dehydrogenase